MSAMTEGQRDYEDTASGDDARVEASWARYTAENLGLTEGQQLYRTKLIITPPEGEAVEYDGLIPISIEEGTDPSSPDFRAELLELTALALETVAESLTTQPIKENV